MTTSIIIDTHAGWPVKVSKFQIHAGVPLNPAMSETIVPPGKIERMHVWDGVIIQIEEMRQDPVDKHQGQGGQGITEADTVGAVDELEGEIIRASREAPLDTPLEPIEGHPMVPYPVGTDQPTIATGYIDPIVAAKVRSF